MITVVKGRSTPEGGFHMLLEHIQAALHHAKYEILPDDGSHYGEIPECNGVYAAASTLELCREELREILEEWVFSGFIKIFLNLKLTASGSASRK